jgi:arylsulfatase A-like enzyme
MKRRFTKVAVGVGVLLCAGAFGAGLEIWLDTYYHLTEPLAGWHWLWSFFHRFKFYTALSAATAGFTAAGAYLWTLAAARFSRYLKIARPGRAAFLAAFMPPLASIPVWYILSHKPVTLPTAAGPRILEALAGGVVLLTALAYQLGRIRPAVNAWAGRLAGGAGWLVLVGYGAAAAVAAVARPAPAPGLPDVYVITLDACRAGVCGPRPDGSTLTPNIDRFAKDAVVFTNCRSQASWTSPSLATLHTGQYPMVHYATADRPLGTSQPTLAELLRAAGYDTEAVVANRLCHRPSGLARGFDDYVYWDQGGLGRRLGYYETYFYYLENRIYERRNTRAGVKDDHTEVITDRVVRRLQKDRRRPLFMWVHYLDPHSPYSPPPAFAAPADRPLIDEFDHGKKKRAALMRRFYDDEVRYVDSELARVFAAARPGAVIFITSDHGEEFWEHDNYDHGKTLYDEVLRVPLVARMPAVPAGVCGAPVGVIDVAPTILGLLGLEVPPSMQGRDISGAPSAPWDFPVFAGSSMLKGERQYSVVYNGFKLIVRHDQELSEGKFFDLFGDAGEKSPLKKRNAERVRAEGLLGRWVANNLEFSKQFKKAKTSQVIRDDMRAVGYIK